MSNTPTVPDMVPAAAALASALPAAGSTQRQGFAEAALERTGQTASAALAAQARAMVEARFVMAMRRPRSWDDVRVKLLQACDRPGFAGDPSGSREKNWGAAWYRKPVGDGVEGFSVRFAEEAMRAMGNMSVVPTTVYDDDTTRIVNVDVIDLESNTSISTSITIEKTIERKQLKKGETALRTRVNSKQEVIYILPATDDDVFSKQQNLIAKARRTGILQLLPGDIQSECRDKILAIRYGKDIAADPGKVRRAVADGFSKVGVLPGQIEEWLGHPLASCSPAELAQLRDIWKAIEEGKLTWAQVMEARDAEDVDEGTDEGRAAAAKSALDGLAAKLAGPQPAPLVVEPEGADPNCPHPNVPEKFLKPGGLAPGEESPKCEGCGRVWKGAPAVAAKPTAAPARDEKPGRQGRLSER